MKKSIYISAIALLFFSFITIKNQLIDYNVNKDFTMVIKGSSNVHDWESTIEVLEGSASVSFNKTGELQIDKCDVRIPAKSIKSSKGNKNHGKSSNVNFHDDDGGGNSPILN